MRGIFKRFDHDHFFEEASGATLVQDVFDYDSPLGFLGKVADCMFLMRYMTAFLKERNKLIKEVAEQYNHD